MRGQTEVSPDFCPQQLGSVPSVPAFPPHFRPRISNGSPSDWNSDADWSNQSSALFAAWAQGINPSVGDFGDPSDTPDGSLSATANNGLTISAAPPNPWYKNPCIQKALAKGALSAGIDAIGLIPGGGAVSEGLSLFHGAAAVSNGTAILGRVQLGAGIITAANGASNTSQLGLAQTALGVGGIVAGVAKAAPVFGQVLSGVSVIVDFVGTGMEIAQCR